MKMIEKAKTKKSRRSSGSITLRDVAKLAGVAPITASRAVNTPDQVSADVLRKVQDAIARTGYVPNLLAGGLASSRSRLIAAVVPSIVVSVFVEMIETLNNTLFDAGYQLMLGQTGYSTVHEEALLEAIIGRRPDGIFLTGILLSPKGRSRLLASGIPVVETWDLTPTPIDMLIGFSHSDIGREVAQFLMAKGRKRFALVQSGDERASRRATAFSEATRQRGLGQVFIDNVGDARTLRSGREALRRILLQVPDVDAVFCSSDLLAMGAMTEALAQNIAVPQRLSIVGFGDVPYVADMVPALTTVHINGREMGEQAARVLVARAEGRTVDQPIVDIGFSIIERDSA
jgi:LacI family transcriptional regulator, gluconate utilization system Gnt-I transcriptional repressor